MAPERLLNKPTVKVLYGDPPDSTFHDRIKSGAIPRPDLYIGPRTPAWWESTVVKHQEALRAAKLEPMRVKKSAA